MKLYEKILIGLVVILFGLQFIDFTGKAGLFSLVTWLLGISYAIGAYKLFNPKDKTSLIISISAGIVFAAALFTLPLTIRIRDEYFLKILPVFNGIFLVVVSLYIYIKRKSKQTLFRETKNILIRSLIILTVTSFFAYCPISLKLYRKLAIGMNKGRIDLVNNILMFDYKEVSETALKEGNCDLAIEYAEKSSECGKIWLGITANELGYLSKEDSNSLLNIIGVFTHLYEVHKCKANDLYDKEKYKEALDAYIVADKNLYIDKNPSPYWEIEKSYSLNLIALCYQSLNEYEKADSLFLKAIIQYKTVKDTNDLNIAIFLSNLADSYSKQGYYIDAIQRYKSALAIRLKDSTNIEIKKDIVLSYTSIAKNYIYCDSIGSAIFYLKNALKIGSSDDENYCSANLCYGVCLYKMSKYLMADSISNQCLECYKKQSNSNDQNIDMNYLLLANINVSLARYEIAKNYIDKGVVITIKRNGKNSIDYAGYLKLIAHINMETGNYTKAEEQFYQVIDIYNHTIGQRSDKQPAVLSELANLELIIGKFNSAKAHSDSSISIASVFADFNYSGTTSLLNDAAYVNYYTNRYVIADTLYKKVIRVNNSFGLNLTSTSAIALNGLGLISTEKGRFVEADSLFRQSLTLHKEIFGESHPFTAVVYLNYASLKIREGELTEAKEILTRSLEINTKFFDSQHDIFADIFVAFGDIANKEKQTSISQDYYLKALEIYAKKFDTKHYKYSLTKKKIK